MRLPRRRRLALVLGLIALLGVTSHVSVLVLARHHEGLAARDWVSLGRDPATFAARAAVPGPNRVALELERLSRQLGLEIAPAVSGRREQPVGGLSRRRGQLESLRRCALELPWTGIDTPEQEGVSLMAAESTRLEAIVELLGDGDGDGAAPRWRLAPARGPAPPVLNVLHDALLARAVVQAHEGRHAAAQRSLDAAWTLTRGLAGRRDDVSLRQSRVYRRRQAMLARRLPACRTDWTVRADEHRQGARVTDGIEAVAWSLGLLAEDPASEATAPWQRFLLPLLSPYLRLLLADCRIDLARIVRLAERSPTGGLPADELTAVTDGVAWWNPVGRILVPSFVGDVEEARETVLELELTRRVLQARERVRASGSLAFSEEPTASGRWFAEPSPNGGFTIRFATPEGDRSPGLVHHEAGRASGGEALADRQRLFE